MGCSAQRLHTEMIRETIYRVEMTYTIRLIKGEVSLDISIDSDSRVTLLVHQVTPPFLDGIVSFSNIRDAVPTVRNASSDFAKMARNGSATLRQLHETKDKNTTRQKLWESVGTRMENAVGVKEEKLAEGNGDIAGADLQADSKIDYKKSFGFAAVASASRKNLLIASRSTVLFKIVLLVSTGVLLLPSEKCCVVTLAAC
mmetsp:Transcript_2520/g.4007  ORF Transcript_2520/g.4007 Transcript_2520/m.4007 type:complete len:200 (-) Transcript_2520:79-678(-)